MGFVGSPGEFCAHGNFAANKSTENPMNTSKHIIAIAALSLAASAFGPTAAIAADSDKVPSRKVQYSDLNLNHEAGAKVLYLRIKHAAESTCTQLNGRQLIERMSQTACEKDAIERAVKQVDAPMLTQYYLTRNPKSDLNPSLAAKR